MSFDSLQERLTALQETTAQVQELIDRLAGLKFQPGSVPLPQGNGNGGGDGDDEDDENVAAELSTEISQALREEEDDLELLAEEITDLRGGKEGSEAARRKERLREGLARLEGEVKRYVILSHPLLSFRIRLPPGWIESLITINNYQRYDDPVVAASSDLTLSLRRAHQAVTAELGRSIAVHETLAESTQKMRQLGTGYSRMDDMLRSSRDLLGVLMKSTKSDTWYLQTTFYLLVGTLGWLVFRRFMYGPLWWLVWFPVRLAFRTGSSAVGMVGSGSGGRPAGASMGVVDERGGAKVVGVGEEGAVPTVEVGGGGATGGKGASEADPDSMVEKVGRIVDRVEEQVGGGEGEGEGEGEVEAEVFVPVSDEYDVTREQAGRVRDEFRSSSRIGRGRASKHLRDLHEPVVVGVEPPGGLLTGIVNTRVPPSEAADVAIGPDIDNGDLARSETAQPLVGAEGAPGVLLGDII
ncbi:hypothetical protein VP1G_03934 [Cytospora mali]|uniref:Sec20 C-terminal domain-containing protein n=1 Tax=Cytospora mali TaxID=578113 RepID=A0A194UXW8_CYTMA|nr:hypothetical protein VP1G_03934 [Valsa mali var. pyri (nom. inval.)]